MKRILLGLLAVSLAAVNLAGCGASGSKLIGTWNCNMQVPGGTLTGTQTYGSDGTSSGIFQFAMAAPEGRVEAQVTMRGTWKELGGNRLEESITAANVPLAMLNGRAMDPSPLENLFRAGIGQTAISSITLTDTSLTATSAGQPPVSCSR